MKILKSLVPFLLLLAITLPVCLPLFKPGFFPTQDFIYVARLFQMDKALQDGHFPVRWAADFRYGEPLFNFYAPLPYYLGALIKESLAFLGIGLSYLVSIKILFGLAFFLSATTMYLFLRRLINENAALLGAVLYLYAPYHSVDLYVRGALSEAWALVFFPLIFLSFYNYAHKRSTVHFLSIALSLAGLFYTHNVMTVIFFPFILGWAALLTYQQRSLKKALEFGVAIGVGIALAASFLLPAFFERTFVQTDHLTDGYFNFRGHFVAIGQFFSPYWGYGASLWGPIDGMSFQIGMSHWVLFLISSILVGLAWFRSKLIRFPQLLMIFGFCTAAFFFSLLMMHNQSAPIWEQFSILAFVQFPWRFLGISIFLISIIGSFSLYSVSEKYQPYLFVLFSGFIIATNIGYFKPESYYLDSLDEHYISPKVLQTDDKLPKDYLPKWVRAIPKEWIAQPFGMDTNTKIDHYSFKTAEASFDVSSSTTDTITIPVTFFPGWNVFVDGQKTPLLESDEKGLIQIKSAPGSHKVVLTFEDTFIRRLSNIISLGAIVLVGVLLLKKGKKR